jgi:macrolide transport system ATP-binding/permease protein
MGQVGGFFRRVWMLIGRGKFRSELDEEMMFHRAQAARAFEAEGMTPKAARLAAARQFGNPARLKESSHEAIGFRVETVLLDLRYALRQLRKNPGFAATVAVILALGIGASVAIFGFVDAALIQPLPYQDPTRLAMLFESIPLGPRFHLTHPDYLDWKRMNKSFSSLEVYAPYGFMMKTVNGTQPADGARVSSGFFRTLGVTPVLGRDFFSSEDEKAHPRVALLSYGAWQKRYGGRPDVLGQAVTLDGKTVTIIGVLPASFHFAPAEPADFWYSLDADDCRGCHGLFGVARLKDGVSFAEAFADIKTVAQQLERQYPDSNRDNAAFMLPLTEVIIGDIRPILLVLLAGAALLMLIATVNVASLLLVRSESRRREIAVRGALGASSGRLVRQFVTEGLLLATVGCLLGLLCASFAMRLMAGLVPKAMMASMPYLEGVGLNFRVVAFAACICVVIGLVFALTPAVRLAFAGKGGSQIREGLAEGGRGAAGLFWRRIGANLVVIELAMAMVLLVGAGLLGKSFYRLLHAEAGLVPDHLATLRVAATGPSYDKDEKVIALERQIAHEVSNLPGVESVAFVSQLPLGDGDGTRGFRVLGRPYHGEHMEVAQRSVSSDYFHALRARITRGRSFREEEDATKPHVVVMNQTMASQYFPGENPLGMRIEYGPDDKNPMEIVGIVNDIQEGQLDAAPRAATYVPFNQNASSYFNVVVRTGADEESFLSTLQATVHRIDPGLAVFGGETMEQRIHDSPAAYLHRSSAWMVGWFAAVALLLGGVGLYGVVAYSVSQRTREIGVRMALGAPRGSVYRMILMEAGWLTAIGVGLGLVCSMGAATLMRNLLFGTAAWDAGTLAAVAVVLAGSAMLASYLPARRAAGVNPVEALRAE